MSGSDDDRDFSDDETEECKKRKLTAKERAQKYIAAKASSSKMGRSLIQKATGDDGTALLDTFQKVMEEYSKSSDTTDMDAATMKKYLFKVMVKCAVHLDNGSLKESEFNDVSIAAANFSWTLVDMCDMPMVVFDVGKLQELLAEIQTGIAALLEPIVKGKSIERLAYLREHMDDGFFQFLLKEEKVADQRIDVGNRIAKILKERRIPRPAQEDITTSKLG